MLEQSILGKVLYYFALIDGFAKPIMHIAIIVLAIATIKYLCHKKCLEKNIFNEEKKFFESSRNRFMNEKNENMNDEFKKADIRAKEPTIEELENLDI